MDAFEMARFISPYLFCLCHVIFLLILLILSEKLCLWVLYASAANAYKKMITLPYSLIMEATEEPDYFGFYSPELEGFSGIGHSVEDCIYKARWGMKEHTALLKEQGLPVPPANPNPKIVIQNEEKRAVA